MERASIDRLLGLTQYFNRRLFLSVLLVAMSSFNYGFDNQAFAATQSMTPFAEKFGEYNAATGKYGLPSKWLSLFNSLNYITFGLGVLFGGWVSTRFGRRWCMFSMSCYALMSATVSVTSNTKSQIMAARILNYFYIGMELSVVPLYQSEIVPAPVRGLVVGCYQLSLGIGGVVINAACYGTSRHFTDDRAWRIPLGLFYIIPSIVAAGIWFVPESPRWLLQQNRPDEARRNLDLLRAGAFSPAAIDIEFRELQHQLAAEAETGRVVELVQGRTNRLRTFIVAGVNFFQQVTGQGFTSQYGAIYVKSLNTFNPILFGLMNACINVGVMLVMLVASDKIGRRKNFFVSGLIMMAALFAMGGLGTQPAPLSVASKKGIMATMSIFGVGFAVGWAPLPYVVSTEVPALRLRDLTTRMGFLVNVVFSFAVNFSIPYMVFPDYANLGSKVGFIFGSAVFLSLVFTYFFVPECKGKTLEQIDFLFLSDTRLRDFGSIPAESVLTSQNGVTTAKATSSLSTDDVEKA